MANFVTEFKLGPETEEAVLFWLWQRGFNAFLELAGSAVTQDDKTEKDCKRLKVLAAMLRGLSQRLIEAAEGKL